MNLAQLLLEIENEEKCVLHEYKDSLGYSTIGIGRLIDVRKGGGITREEAIYLFNNNVKLITESFDNRIPWWKTLSDGRQRALVNMAFQLGVEGVLEFTQMIEALCRGDYQKAQQEGLDSKWATQDTPYRAQRITDMFLKG